MTGRNNVTAKQKQQTYGLIGVLTVVVTLGGIIAAIGKSGFAFGDDRQTILGRLSAVESTVSELKRDAKEDHDRLIRIEANVANIADKMGVRSKKD
jgi:hypothetical protein